MLGQLLDGREPTGRAGEVMCWGTKPGRAVMTGAIAIAFGQGHGCAATTTSVWCWGTSDWGEIGDGTMIHRQRPVPVSFGDLP